MAKFPNEPANSVIDCNLVFTPSTVLNTSKKITYTIMDSTNFNGSIDVQDDGNIIVNNPVVNGSVPVGSVTFTVKDEISNVNMKSPIVLEWYQASVAVTSGIWKDRSGNTITEAFFSTDGGSSTVGSKTNYYFYPTPSNTTETFTFRLIEGNSDNSNNNLPRYLRIISVVYEGSRYNITVERYTKSTFPHHAKYGYMVATSSPPQKGIQNSNENKCKKSWVTTI